MLPSFLLALREGLEAALVIGIVLGALHRLRRTDCARIVWLGVATGGLFSVGVALALRALGLKLHGPAEPISEGVTLLLAAALLTWMIAWMNRQASHLRGAIANRVREAVCTPGRGGVFWLTFIAVAREGTELAVFLAAAGFDSSGVQSTAGASLGLGAAAGLSSILFATTIRLNLTRFFRVTSTLLILFAAGLVAKAVHEFNEVGWIPAIVRPVWNTRQVLDEHSLFGTAARTLLGYTSTPSLTALIGYIAYLAGAIAVVRLGTRASSAPQRAPRLEALTLDSVSQNHELNAPGSSSSPGGWRSLCGSRRG
jgi:high-affinity iron transporter